MRIMTRMGAGALEVLGDDGEFVPCLHSVGRAARAGPGGRRRGRATRRTSTSSTSPRPARSWSYGSGYGGNALLGKKCFALRIASVMARDDGWLAEHMLILKLTSPEGETRYVAGAFPSACGKTNLAMLIPTLAGLEGRDDRRRHLLDEVRRRRPPLRHQPRGRLLRRRAGHQHDTNPNAILTLDGNSIFTNTALTDDGDVWWEGMTDEPPAHLIDWKGKDWTPESGTTGRPPELPLHRAGRPGPGDRPRVGGPGRRADRRHPLRRPPRLASSRSSSSRATGSTACSSARSWRRRPRPPQAGAVGNLRRDPFAMLPFCGYNMADYFAHWLDIGAEAPDREALPKIFYVNWFRKDADGKFLWPGYGENSRVLEWIFDRVTGKARPSRRRSARVPTPGAIDTSGLDVTAEDMEELLRVDVDGWRAEVPLIREHYAQFGDRLPQALAEQVDTLETAPGLRAPVSGLSAARTSRATHLIAQIAEVASHRPASSGWPVDPTRRRARPARPARPWWRRPGAARRR